MFGVRTLVSWAVPESQERFIVKREVFWGEVLAMCPIRNKLCEVSIRRFCSISTLGVIASAFSLLSTSSNALVAADVGIDFFEKRVRPLLVQHCYECHSAESDIVQGELRLDAPQYWTQGGPTGPAVVPNNPQRSLLLTSIEYADEDLQMPPDGKLSGTEIAVFRRWIESGAPAPKISPRVSNRPSPDNVNDMIRDLWSLARVRSVDVPEVHGEFRSHTVTETGGDWAQSPIDAFVLRRLHDAGLPPASQASKHELIRRATFDLTGLPPTPEEIDSFLADGAPDAFEKVVDRLLASPHYGERWGRYWLDLARYADTNGADENKAYGNAWRYRDYVIRALNADKPYDRFVLEQLAGDLLPVDPEDDDQQRDHLTATGFLVLGPKMLAEQDKEKLVMDIVDEQIDVLGQTFLGLTLGCGRCHDHKFDPFSTEDYYAMAGIFKSTSTMADLEHVSKWQEQELQDAEVEAALQRFTADVQPQIDALNQRVEELVSAARNELQEPGTQLPEESEELEELFPEQTRQALAGVRREIEKLESQRPTFPVVMSVCEGTPQDVPVHLRGSHLNLGEERISRRIPAAFANMDGNWEMAADSSGRLEFAHWLIDPEHPLTARVMVNRIWQGHFGEGLVRSPSNFGTRGDEPTHPDLLDWLAQEFIRQGWSIKQMHRLMMTSSTYQMRVVGNARAAEVDPDNRLLWRQNRRRLEAESIRDTLLCAADRLNQTMGGSLLTSPNNEYSRESADDALFDTPCRAIYLPVLRNKNYELFSIFDYSNPAVHVAKRSSTVVAHQALFFMNSPFVAEQAQAIAGSLVDKLGESASAPPRETIDRLFKQLYARPADGAEVDVVLDYLKHTGAAEPAPEPLAIWSELIHALLARNEFVYVD